jgi:predicted AAA+ superfamily ATPase
MRLFSRTLEKQIAPYLSGKDNPIFFIWGPRRSGKTTLLQKTARSRRVPVFNFDLQSDQEKFLPRQEILEKVAALPVVLIDEIQNYPESTVALKILHDKFGTKIIATGSSELRQKSADFDSLAGRYEEHYCLPFALSEIAANTSVASHEQDRFFRELARGFQNFGAYPEVYLEPSAEQKTARLQTILDAYVLKDIINIYELKNTKLAKDILTKIALQIGSEVSVREVASSLQANVGTVANYLEIFVRNYILIPLPSFRTNMRRAVSENRKFYFYDLGIRNILVRDFRELDLRPDKGGLWENFVVAEVEKERRNQRAAQNLYFYREYGGKEVDLVIESYYKKYRCLEIKSSEKPAGRRIFPLEHRLTVVTPDNYSSLVPRLFTSR